MNTSLIWQKAIARMHEENSYVAKLTPEEYALFDEDDFSDDFVWYIEEKKEYWVELVKLDNLSLSPDDQALLDKAHQKHNDDFLEDTYKEVQHHIEQNENYSFGATEDSIAVAIKAKFGIDYTVECEPDEDSQIDGLKYSFNIVAFNRKRKINRVITS